MGQKGGWKGHALNYGGKKLITNDKIMQALKEVVDPEIGLNVVDLNMIRDVNIGAVLPNDPTSDRKDFPF